MKVLQQLRYNATHYFNYKLLSSSIGSSDKISIGNGNIKLEVDFWAHSI